MKDIQIHEIESDQIDQYKQFINLGLVHDEESFRITPTDDLNTGFPTKDLKDSFTLGAYSDNVLIGVVSFARDGIDREKLRHKGVLFRMYVDGDFRGQGVARRLIKEVLSRVKLISDIEQINLTVISSNKNAKTLYESFGFRTFGSEQNAIKWENKYFNEDQMVLQLNYLF